MISKFFQKVFKIISYGFFFKIYGKIEETIKSTNNSRVEIKKINFEKDLEYNIYIINSGRLYTDRIHDTAILIDNKILEEPSFQLRYTKDSKVYNANSKDNIVFEKGTPRKLKNFDGKVLSLLTGGGGNDNYWHWLFDVLPRFGLCSKILNLNEIDYFLLPSVLRKFQAETLDCLKIPKNKCLSSIKYRHIKAKKLIVTDHPVVVSGNATEDIQNMPEWIFNWLKNSFLNEDTMEKSSSRKKIFIDRNNNSSINSSERLIENEKEVKEYLLKNNFAPVKLHETNFKDQVNLFYNAECIIGLHGGGFGNIVFCKPQTKIIEFRSLTAGPVIENLAKKNHLNYNSIISEARQEINKKLKNQQGSIHIDMNNLIKVLEN